MRPGSPSVTTCGVKVMPRLHADSLDFPSLVSGYVCESMSIIYSYTQVFCVCVCVDV